MNPKYCVSWVRPERVPTIEVKIGKLLMGSAHPVRIQSMTTSDTMDTQKSVAEAIRMIDAGCELVRLTAPSKLEAENLAVIQKELHDKHYTTPLVADIHFTPNAAEIAATIVEKVRINPGNYADKKKFATLEYTPETYQTELEKIEKKFLPLLKLCKKHGTALRIGTNHGSLSDRIMSYFGDTPEGMVQSALEFLDFCEKQDFYNIVISMKSSNVQVMVYAYRLLMSRLFERKYVYPMHLGVTEAGEGEDGRIKSAMGIGALLADGIGDTIRVSLTEAAELEMPVARYITQYFEYIRKLFVEWQQKHRISLTLDTLTYQPFEFNRRPTHTIINIGSTEIPRVLADFSNGLQEESDLASIGYKYQARTDKWNTLDTAADYIYIGKQAPPFMLPNGLRAIMDFEDWAKLVNPVHIYPYFSSIEQVQTVSSDLVFVRITPEWILSHTGTPPTLAAQTVLILDSEFPAIQVLRTAICRLDTWQWAHPILLKVAIQPLSDSTQTDEAVFQLTAACITGPLAVDGRIDGIWFTAEAPFSRKLINQTSFSVLQAGRLRITKTEYISCPSCGRTLFDLQETTAMIRKRTEHLKGVKIGIMGCIVNGPGEMADADFGYVGAGPGIITLYKGKEVVERAVKAEEAVDKLIELIKKSGMWIEP